jgi:methylglutaconyl-CoA hydratase
MEIKVTTEGSVLKVLLNRPEAHNALSPEMISSLTKIFLKVKTDKNISAVMLKGDGKSFCAGGDLNWMRKSLSFTKAQNIKDTSTLANMYEAIFQCPTPVIAYVHGNVMGGGLGLTAVCDIVAANVETKFCFTETKLGLAPSIIAPYVLRKMPENKAKLLMFTAEIFKADEAYDAGLVHFVGSDEACDDFLSQRLKMIVSNGPEAVRITKNLIHKMKTSEWNASRTFSIRTIAERRTSKEGQEGISAFFEKRAPAWRREK